jgi:ribonuclease Y
MITTVVAIAAGALALMIGVAVGRFVQRRRYGRAAATAEEIVSRARREAQQLLARSEEQARATADAYRERESATLEHRRLEITGVEERISQREATLEQRAANLAQRETLTLERERELSEARLDVERLREQARNELEKLAGIDAKAAKAEMLQRVEDEARREAMVLMRDLELKAREESDRRARRILTASVQRLAAEVVSETTVSVVPLPRLIADGRIHPASIEDAHAKAVAEVEQSVRDAGEWALLEVALTRVHPELINLLGRLKYRMSYGQNVLNHLVESAKVAGMLAAEIGADADEARRAAFLHDIGKAVSHELGGSHALVGAEIARRFGEAPAIVHAIESHHNEVEPRTVTAVLVQAADAVSAARPGARREAVESYVRRLERLEELAGGFDGVDRVFAMQAGREVRVVVDPGQIDDLAASDLARRISRRLEDELQYPGQIQVTVIRELRAVDYAR